MRRWRCVRRTKEQFYFPRFKKVKNGHRRPPHVVSFRFCMGRSLCCALLNFLIKFVKQRAREELAEGHIKPITKLFNGSDGYTLPGWIKHAIHRRWCHTRADRQLVWTHFPLVTELFKAFGNGIFYCHDEIHLNVMVQKFVRFCVRSCVYHESISCYREYVAA